MGKLKSGKRKQTGKRKEDKAPRTAGTSLEELIRQQGVKPITDVDELTKLMPVDDEDDPEAMLRFILNERAAQRRIAKRREL